MRSPSPLIIVPIGLLLLIVIFVFLLRSTFQQNVTVDPSALPAESAVGESRVDISAENPSGHLVQAGETLTVIAGRYGITLNALVAANNIANPDLVEVGTRLVIPEQVGIQSAAAPSNSLIPDSELVYGPSMQGVSVESLVPSGSFLWGFSEAVEGTPLSGVEIVRLVAERTRVNPRLLLAALEYRSGWTTGNNPRTTDRPLGYTNLIGLYRQLEWTANLLNLGYYSRSEIGLSQMQLTDGTPITLDGSITSGTAGVQMWLAQQPNVTLTQWQQEVSSDGFMATYRSLFGDPFAYEVALLPAGLTQPLLSLPWEVGETWHFSGGPHGGWISGSAWAALDFLPGGELFGCYIGPQWVTAMADGVITRSDFGAVVLDLDGDGYTGTGWAILYQHVATQDRVAVGTRVQRGNRIGHPSCEGGFSTGTHLHVARMFNGRWISADSPSIPFTISGWVSQGAGSEYNGTLTRGDVSIAADAIRGDVNAITNR